MHENWLQRYIKEHYQQIGFTRINGTYKTGADFKGIYADKPVKIEVEWEYSNYISHKHSPAFADVLVVATVKPVPPVLKEKLPPIIIHLNLEDVIEWAQPRLIKQNKEDYYSYPWRRLSRSLLDLYVYYLKQDHQLIDFIGSDLALSMNKTHQAVGFQFGVGGKEEVFEGSPEDKASWDYWLVIAHTVANHFKFKPALLRPTWVDRLALFFNHTGRITESELERFKDVAGFIDELIQRGEP